MSDESFNVDALIDELIEREGAYVNHAADKGGRGAGAWLRGCEAQPPAA